MGVGGVGGYVCPLGSGLAWLPLARQSVQCPVGVLA